MSKETARWLLLGAHAFQKDPKLRQWQGVSRENFTLLLTSIFGVKDFDEAVSLLEKVVAEELTAPSIPSDLTTLLEDWKRAKEQKEEAQRVAAQKVALFIQQQKNLYNPEGDIANLKPQINRQLQEYGLALGPKQIENFIKRISLVTEPEILKIREFGEKPLPDEVMTRLAQEPAGVAFPALYLLFSPRLTLAYLKRAIFFLPVKILQYAEVSPEQKEIIKRGIFAEDIQTTIHALLEAGLPRNHPIIKKLKARLQELLAIQKNEKGKDKPWVKLLKHYHRLDQELDRPLYDPETKIFLVRKSAEGGYLTKLKRALNKVGLLLGVYERISLGPEKTVLRFSLPSKIIRFFSFGKFESFEGFKTWVFRHTARKAILFLGKTAIGKVIKEGVKKGATWLATKLGMETGIFAVGVAGAGPTLGTSLLIAAAIEIGIKILKKIGQFLKKIIISLTKEPEKAFGTTALGIILLIFLPAFPFLGFSLIGLGTLGLLPNLGTIFRNTAAGITSFFTILFTIPSSTAPITTLVLGLLGGLSILTFLIIMTTSAAFILPSGPKGPTSFSLEVKKTANPNRIENNSLPRSIAYTVNINGKNPLVITNIMDQRTISCKGVSPQFEKQVNIPPPEGEISNWSTNYTLNVDSSFADCLLCNTVTVTADIPKENISGQSASSTQCVTIGNPPEDCPLGWPTTYGYITQGPNTNYPNSHYQLEAIDIGVGIGTPVYATHRGIVVAKGFDTKGGNFVVISGSCNNRSFTSHYLHLNTIAVQEGEMVNRGTEIGTSGNTGTYSSGPHLHYHFNGLEMASPYIPIDDDVLEGCITKANCNTQW